jgi:hypothetical protein
MKLGKSISFFARSLLANTVKKLAAGQREDLPLGAVCPKISPRLKFALQAKASSD